MTSRRPDPCEQRTPQIFTNADTSASYLPQSSNEFSLGYGGNLIRDSMLMSPKCIGSQALTDQISVIRSGKRLGESNLASEKTAKLSVA